MKKSVFSGLATARWIVVVPFLLGGCLDAFDDSDTTQEEECTPAPAGCDHSIPDEADLTIRVSTPLPEVVTIYSGDAYETGTIIWSGSPKGTYWSVRLPLGDYSATATYKQGGKTIIAVDGDDLAYESTDTCEGECYDEVDGTVDLELAGQ